MFTLKLNILLLWVKKKFWIYLNDNVNIAFRLLKKMVQYM